MNKFTFAWLVNKLLLVDYIKGLWFSIKQLYLKKTKASRSLKLNKPRFKGIHALLRYSNNRERCVGCKLCAVVCPGSAINIEASIKDDGTKYASIYEIDLFKCSYCGLCEEACPVDAIVQTNIEDYHFSKRGTQILSKDKLLAIGEYYIKQNIEHSKDEHFSN